MGKKTPAEIQQPEITEATRMRIRLKHSLAADQEINSVMPDTLEEFEGALVMHRPSTSATSVPRYTPPSV